MRLPLFWIILALTALYTWLSAHTRYKWAPLLCVTLLLIVPRFFPPSALGIYAIVITQLTDSYTLALSLRAKVKGTPFLTLAKGIPLLVLGSFLLLFFGCGIALLTYSLGALLTALFILGVLPPLRRMAVATRVGSIILLSISAFGLPALITHLKSEATGSTRVEPSASLSGYDTLSGHGCCDAPRDTNLSALGGVGLENAGSQASYRGGPRPDKPLRYGVEHGLLLGYALVGGLLNLSVAFLKFPPSSFPLSVLVAALAGASIGKAAATTLSLTRRHEPYTKVYGFVLIALALVSFHFYPAILRSI